MINVNKVRRSTIAIINFDRLPDDPGKRADINHALRILKENDMLEKMVTDKPGASDSS